MFLGAGLFPNVPSGLSRFVRMIADYAAVSPRKRKAGAVSQDRRLDFDDGWGPNDRGVRHVLG